MPNDSVAGSNKGDGLPAMEEHATVNGDGEISEETAEPTMRDTPTEPQSRTGSLKPVEQHTVQNGAHDHQQPLYETQNAWGPMTSPAVVPGGWQSMPFEGEVEEVFAWELGEGSEGMPALDCPESLILVAGEEPEDMLDDSPSRLEWLRQKRDDAEENEHLDRVMAMIGHEPVKEHFLAVKGRAAIARKWNEDPRDLKLNLVLHEGPDIVAKRIAHLYSKFLFSVGVISRIKFERTDEWHSPDVAGGSRSTVIQFLRTINKGSPGSGTTSDVSTVDNTYEDQEIQHMIKEARDSTQHMVLAVNLDEITKEYSRALVWNLEARRQFPINIRLGGYDEGEFVQLLVRMVKQRSLQVEGGFQDPSLRVLVKRALRRHKSGSMSQKVCALKTELDVVCYRGEKRQEQEYLDWARTHTPDDEAKQGADEFGRPWRPIWPKKEAVIKRKDIFGPEPEDTRDKSKAWKTIQQLVGLETVKKHISQLFDRVSINYQRQIQGLDPIPVTLNHVFVGEPGVGKTTVAKLYGQILSELNMLSAGAIIQKNPSDLIESCIGGSEEETKNALESAMGSVLIIDDADMLYHSSGHGTSDNDSFRDGVIDTIVANVSGQPGEDRCVILIGNKDRMKEMFLNSNAGLQRRFPIEDAVKFENYNVDQLCQILDRKMAEDGNTEATAHAKKVAREVLSRMSERPKFGNAGDVVSLLARARLRHAERREAAGGSSVESYAVTLEPEDFDPDYDRASRADQSRDSLFSGFVGFEKIINQFRQYQLMANGMRKHEIDPRPHIPWAFVFKGPPGTGKTSTARKVGKLFYDIGLLSSDEVVVCSATDLMGQYQGGTGPKVINLFESSLGKVLFIDEAYRLRTERGSSSVANEAVGELVDAMTKPRYSGKMVVVLAGYTEDMEDLLQSNPGLRSRFPTDIDFPCMGPQQCVQHLRQELGKLKIDLSDGNSNPKDVEKWSNIYSVLTQLSVTKGWANGRDIETLAKTLIRHVFVKAATTSQAGVKKGRAPLAISLDELMRSLQCLLRERNGLSNGREYSAGR